MTVGASANDTFINVTLITSTAGEHGEHFYMYVFVLPNKFCFSLTCSDFHLLSSQIVITAANPQPCVTYMALADNIGLEGLEMLTLSLSRSDDVVTGNSILNIFIDDANGKHMIQAVPFLL